MVKQASKEFNWARNVAGTAFFEVLNMKVLPAILWGLAGLGGLAFIGAFVVESSFASRAKTVQIVRVTATDELFGGPGYETIGSPQKMVVDAPQATLKDAGPNGEVLLDKEKLDNMKIYPLQLQSVQFATGIAKAASGAVAVLFGVVAFLVGRRAKTKAPEEPES